MERNHFFDFLRGVAIMMVVGIHTFSMTETDMNGLVDLNALVRQILNCAVPLFLAISGYFLCSKKLNTWEEKKSFWKRQIPKVYIPTMIVSLPYLALNLAHGMNPINAVVMMLICGYSIYYFIALILQYYVLLPILQKVKSGGVIWSAVISLVSISGISYITKVVGLNLPLIAYAGPFPVWCVFFVMGCYLHKTRRDYSLLMPLIITLLGLAMSYAETYYWNTNYGGGFGIKFSSFTYSMTAITLLFSAKTERIYKRNFVNKIVERIGGVSFAIYLYHLFVYDVFSKLHIITQGSWVIRWIICLITTIIVIEIAKRILPRKFHWCFGI